MFQILDGPRGTLKFQFLPKCRLLWLFALLAAFALASTPAAAQQNVLTNNSEVQIADLFSSTGQNAPILSENSYIDLQSKVCPSTYPLCADIAGWFTSAAYDLGNGLYLYAYRAQSGFPCTVSGEAMACELDAVHLTVPLGGNAPVAGGAVTTGVYWIGTLSSLQASYSTCDGYENAFTWFNPTSIWGILCEEVASDPITSATVENATSPTAVTFTFPGVNYTTCDVSCTTPYFLGYPNGVTFETPVFGFISSVPPTVLDGQFATDSSGQLLPAFKMVAPTVITMIDPDPDLLVTSSDSSGTGPSVTVTNDPNALATGGRLVQGVAADGVAEVLLRIPAGAVGQQLTLTLAGGQDAGYSNANEDGGLADPLAPGPENTTFSQTVTVTAVSVTTAQGTKPMAFALYQPPKDFPRSAGEDASLTTRVESVQFASPSGLTPGVPPALKITIVRPPVVLVHGLWGSANDWNNFAPLYSLNSSLADPKFSTSAADYDVPLGTNAVVSPNYPFGSYVLSQATTNSLGFSFNAPWVLSQIKVAVWQMRDGKNPLNAPVAAVQADIVAHSMGADVARAAAEAGDYLLSANYGKGVIHKLIAIGAPFLGSPLANDLLGDSNTCVRDILAAYGDPSFSSVTLDYGTANSATFGGAVGDLEGQTFPTVSPGPAILALDEPTPPLPPDFTIPTAFIAGLATSTNLGGLGCDFCYAHAVRDACPNDPLAAALTPTGWPGLFGESSDAVVPFTSQVDDYNNDLSLLSVNYGFIHSAGLTKLDFNLPDELGDGDAQTMANAVEQLLNTPVTDPHFFGVP